MQLWEDGHRPQLTKFRWNSQNQLIGVQTPGGQQWDYRYDAFGRRTDKVCERAGMRTTYLWDGDVPAEIREYRHNRLYSIRHLVFDGWQLLAQQVQFFTPNPENRDELRAGDIQTQYAVCAPTGEPLALFDAGGHRVWRQPAQSLYGLRLGVPGENAELNPGLKFAGQWLDEESGLVYNRFRYYSPVASCYLTPDPIGLMGGVNPYSYAPNPTGWIDPLGLAVCPERYARYKEFRKQGNIALDAGKLSKSKGGSWGKYLTKLTGTTPPPGMWRPHAHHIVFQKGPAAAKEFIKDSQRILREAGIDPKYGVENLVWAPNKNHSVEAAKKVNDVLKEAVSSGRSVKDTLAELGELFAKDKIL
ncbi:RHS repeat-associated core domain-containing protein [Xenorhabdus bovienii]|uniref:RHS repeat-associated core domain-containing protein n=1 Tax=Xenorhabdus bovienii TaxID=40576 RepID=UPI0023B22B23|nr:RHS repeat-associated core domain-containing protein [Xenorhabdus bovienii]